MRTKIERRGANVSIPFHNMTLVKVTHSQLERAMLAWPTPKQCCFVGSMVVCLFLAGCQSRGSANTVGKELTDARKQLKTQLIKQESDKEKPDRPPKGVFDLVQYDGPLGKMNAYVTSPPADTSKKLPAIIWITGGDCNSIGDVWSRAEPANDQTASSYRASGMVMMFPSLRGANGNPGVKETFLGEIDDIIAAGKHLASLPHVDAKRIYLGGHSTGGTTVMLVAQSTDMFRCVFSFGPVHDVAGYGGNFTNCKPTKQEIVVRSPGNWLHCIKSPLFVIEGEDGNSMSVEWMKKRCKNERAHFLIARKYDHFSVLKPVNDLIAKKISNDTGETCNIAISESELK